VSREAIESLLREKIGLDPILVGTATIERAVRQRLAACGLSEAKAYLDLLMKSEKELEELIELVLIPETWFFRDKEPFLFLRNYAETQWLPFSRGRKLRILSAPCSSGEEPYSIAISLFETGLSAGQFQIDAVDISRKALGKAKNGVYGKNSFRYQGFDFRGKYFEETGEGLVVIPMLKETVNFIQGNILEKSLFAGKGLYDIIFCRNLLIYLDHSSRDYLIQVLERLLASGGLLFVGHAETLRNFTRDFQLVSQPKAFAYIKRPGPLNQYPAIRETVPDFQAHRTEIRKLRAGRSLAGKSRAPSKNGAESKKRAPAGNQGFLAGKKKSLLDKAGELADRGCLEEAASLCERFLEEYGPTAKAFCLLGIIRQAQGDIETAEKCLNRSVYLEPDNYEALVHLALLLEYRKEREKALILRQRAGRIYMANEVCPESALKKI